MTEDGIRPANPAFWLIYRAGDGRPEEVLTFGETLAVFGFEEEADMFLWLGEIGDGWCARRYEAADVAALLAGPLVGVERVALDPLPENTVGADGRAVLGKGRFLERLLGLGSLVGEGETA